MINLQEFLVSKETVVLSRWERSKQKKKKKKKKRSKQKFGFIKRVDKG